MFFLEKLNVPVKSHSSVISMEQLVKLREFSENKNKGKFSAITDEFNRMEKERKRRAKARKDAAAAQDQQVDEQKEVKKEEIKVEIKQEVKVEVKEEVKQEAKQEVKEEVKEVKKEVTVEKIEPKKEEIRREEPVSRIPEQPRVIHPRPKPEVTRVELIPREERDKSQRPQKPQRPQPRPPQQEARKDRPDRPEKRKEKEHHKPGKGPRPDQPPREDRKEKPHRDRPEAKKPDERPPKKFDKKPFPPKPGKRTHEAGPPRDQKGDNRGKQVTDFKKKKKKPRERDDRRMPQGMERQKAAPKPPPPKPKVKVYNTPELIQIPDFITLKELAEKLNLKLKDIEERMGLLKKEYATNQILELQQITEICEEFKVEVDMVPYEDSVFFNHIEKSGTKPVTRASVVTVMGHVDHGKTTLLDTLRNTRVAAREAGGITQKIGAYKLTTGKNEIIFVDTPGHEAFTNIRARGAKVTDIVILVVAANDGVQPQTVEAINHARAAEVPIIVAINKIDLPGADPNRVKQDLTKHNLVVEDWGGDVVSVEISAKHNENLDALLEMVILSADMLELTAFKKIPARGTIIESRLDPKLGPLGTVLIQHGDINKGDFFICGNHVGKIKSIFDDMGKVPKNVEPPLPVEIMGFESVPEAGELFQVVDDVDKARKVIDMRIQRGRDAKQEEVMADKKLSLQNLFERMEETKTKDFPIIMKTDNYSSSEVLESILLKQSSDKIKITIVHQGIGNINEGDILLSSTSGAIILGFNVKAPTKIISQAKHKQIEIKLYNVIYHLIEDIEKAIKGEIEPEYIETKIGMVEVLQTFKISKLGLIAGCIVREGKITNKSRLKVLRKDDLVFEGEVETLRRVKNEVAEVNAGTECGIKIKNFNSIEVGDMLEVNELKVKE